MHPFFGATETAPVLSLSRATILWKDGLVGGAYSQQQVRDLDVRFERHAQYERAVVVSFVPKGARRRRCMVGTRSAALMVLDGWVDAVVPDAYHPPVESSDVSVQRARALSCAPMWAEEARAAARFTGVMLADYHEHNPAERL